MKAKFKGNEIALLFIYLFIYLLVSSKEKLWEICKVIFQFKSQPNLRHKLKEVSANEAPP